MRISQAVVPDSSIYKELEDVVFKEYKSGQRVGN